MALPQAFGFMPLQEAWTQNWEQSPAWSPDEMAALDLGMQRNAARQRYQAQPFGDSFLRRFGAPLVAAPQTVEPQITPEMQAMLMGQLRSAVAGSGDVGNNSAMLNMGAPNEMIFQGTGAINTQPWYDEYMNLAKAGGDLPMVKSNNATPLSDEAKAGIAERRAARLAKGAPALSLDERKQNVMQNAIAKSEQRASRMGDLSPNQQWLNEVGRFAGEGGVDENMLNMLMGGPQYASDMARTNAITQEISSKQQMATDPKMLWLQHITSGGTMSFPQFQRELGSGTPGAMLGPSLGPREAAEAATAAVPGYGQISQILDSLSTTMPNASAQEMLQALSQAGITRQALNDYIEDKPSMPYGFTPGPLSFIPWLLAGENEQEMRARQNRENYAQQLLSLMGP